MYRDIADIVYSLDVLVVIVYISHCNALLGLFRIEVSVLRTGQGCGGGGVEVFITSN